MDPVLVGRVALPLLVLVFGALLLVRPVLRLRRQGIQAVALHHDGGAGQRVGALGFLGLLLALPALAAAYALGGPAAVGAWSVSAWSVGPGLALAGASTALVVWAQHTMGASFRIGIDREPTALVTSGPFRTVRHPIFSGLLGLGAAVVLIVPCAWSVALWLGSIVVVAHHTRAEERHLLAQHGDAYRRYAARTGRLLPGLGRLRSPEAA